MTRVRRQFPGATAYSDRHGRRRWRFRKGAFSRELGGAYGSDEFVRRYEAAVAGQRPPQGVGSDRTRPGTIDALIASWYRSPAYLDLKDSTRQTYRGVVERFRAEHGHRLVADLRRGHVITIMGRKAETPGAANFLLRMIRQLLDHAVDIEWRPDNPARTVKMFATGGTRHTWSEAEIAQFYSAHRPGTVAHTAMTLMLYTGAARADAVALGWQNLRGDRLIYKRRKTDRITEIEVDIPVLDPLAAVLDGLPRNALTFLQTRQGAARSPAGLGNDMRRWCDQAGLPVCTSHGLRKAMARRLAEGGATTREIMSRRRLGFV